MTDFLNEQIRAAQEAAREVAEADAKRALAEQLPMLERQVQIEQKRAETEANFQQIKAEAKVVLEQTRPVAEEWRTRFEAVLIELEKLSRELPEAQRPIIEVGHKMRVAAQERALFSPRYVAMGEETGDGMDKHWVEIGGSDPGLNFLPEKLPTPFSLELFMFLQKHFPKLRPYNATQWHIFF